MIESIGFGLLVPALVAMATVLICRRWLPVALASRYAMTAGLAAGFVVGYILLPPWAELVPTRHWHWLLYLAPAGLFVGPIARAQGVAAAERWALYGALAIAASFLLVPDWQDMAPPRRVLIAAQSVGLFASMVLLPPLAGRLPVRLFLAQLAAVAAILALVIAIFVSLQYGQLAGLAAASMCGCLLASLRSVDSQELCCVIPLFTLLVGGAALVGYLEPQPPLTGILVVGFSPLALCSQWILSSPARDGVWGKVVPTTALFLTIALGVALVALA